MGRGKKSEAGQRGQRAGCARRGAEGLGVGEKSVAASKGSGLREARGRGLLCEAADHAAEDVVWLAWTRCPPPIEETVSVGVWVRGGLEGLWAKAVAGASTSLTRLAGQRTLARSVRALA